MSVHGKIRIERRKATVPPPGSIEVQLSVDDFFAALNVRYVGGMVTLYLDPAIIAELADESCPPVQLEVAMVRPGTVATSMPKRSEADSRRIHSDTVSKPPCAGSKTLPPAKPPQKEMEPW